MSLKTNRLLNILAEQTPTQQKHFLRTLSKVSKSIVDNKKFKYVLKNNAKAYLNSGASFVLPSGRRLSAWAENNATRFFPDRFAPGLKYDTHLYYVLKASRSNTFTKNRLENLVRRDRNIYVGGRASKVYGKKFYLRLLKRIPTFLNRYGQIVI